jgi:phosphate transport system permease protein
VTLFDAHGVEAPVRARLAGSTRDLSGRAFQFALLGTLLLTLAFLAALIGSVLDRGFGVLTDRGMDFLTTGTSGDPTQAGVWQALVGSFWIVVIVGVIAFPMGIAAAIYLEEYAAGRRLTRFIQINIRNLAGVPSIVYGILGLTIFVKALGDFTGGRSVLAAGLALAVLVLPIVIITAAEALRAVPDSLREAGFGVGAGKWEVIRHHVLPYAAPGILTGTVLALARALGEAAPLILVGAATGFFSAPGGASLWEEMQGPFTALPMLVYDWSRQPGDDWRANASAAIIVMLVVVLAANAAAILLRNHYDKKRTH